VPRSASGPPVNYWRYYAADNASLICCRGDPLAARDGVSFRQFRIEWKGLTAGQEKSWRQQGEQSGIVQIGTVQIGSVAVRFVLASRR